MGVGGFPLSAFVLRGVKKLAKGNTMVEAGRERSHAGGTDSEWKGQAARLRSLRSRKDRQRVCGSNPLLQGTERTSKRSAFEDQVAHVGQTKWPAFNIRLAATIANPAGLDEVTE